MNLRVDVGAADTGWFFPRHTAGDGGWESVVNDSMAGWQDTGLRIGELAAGESLLLEGSAVERIVIPLAGTFSIVHDSRVSELRGRASVFDGPTDVLYLGSATAAVVSGVGRFAVAESPSSAPFPSRLIRADDVPVEVRGAGASQRLVHNFGTPEALDADRLIVCEVITPAGNWSSWPSHKHDEDIPGRESRLEEIYYFEVAAIPGAASAGNPFGLFYTANLATTVQTGDIALIPSGYHGPAAAAPGYEMYYLNVMAGTSREWLISDDPQHSWIRDTWRGDDA